VIALNMEGLVAGCLGLSCFSFDELGAVCIDLNEVLVMGRKIRDEVSGGTGDEHEAMCMDFLDNEIFVCPEVLSKLLNKGVISPESRDSRYPIGYGSNVWSLACVLLRLLIGNAFPRITLEVSEGNGFDVLASYISWVEKVNSVLEEKFGSEYLSLKQTLCKCLDINPGSRPDVVDVRKCIQELVKHQFGFLEDIEITVNSNNIDHPVILAMLFQLVEESSKALAEHEVKEDGGQPDFLQGAENKSDEDFVASLSNGMTGMTELKELQGHLGCITGLATGGLKSEFIFKCCNIYQSYFMI
jgi:preprotein translocase subunit SecA